MDLNNTLEKRYWDELEKEGITKDCLDIVMLDIEFSPVTPFKNCVPCKVLESRGDKYIVMAPTGEMYVSAEELKVMRYRYLQLDTERAAQRNRINRMFK